MPTAAVIVIGDVGRSPRTANHALSLAEKGYEVRLIGYAESALNERIAAHERIKILALPPPPSLPLPELGLLCWRFGWTALMLMVTLMCRVGWSLDLVLVQNPPALPALIVAWMACRLRRARFVIDWHNYTWSMLSERWGISERVLGLEMHGDSEEVKQEKLRKREAGGKASYIRLTHSLEGRMGRAADGALCVSAAMAADLEKRWGVRADVFYDRPPGWKFGEVSLARKHELLCKLAGDETWRGDERKEIMLRGGQEEEEDVSLLARLNRYTGELEEKQERPLIMISSTSWTPDEDFSILLEALVRYSEKADEEREVGGADTSSSTLPCIFVMITGKGPDKAQYMERIRELDLSHVSFYAPWLEAADYPVAVAAADVGVCLHTSTSGVDLPMKVVDMFGCGVPVLAKRFDAIGELVEEDRNGYLFDSSEDLCELIVKIARGHYDLKNTDLLRLQSYLRTEEGRLRSWEETWPQATMRAFGMEI